MAQIWRYLQDNKLQYLLRRLPEEYGVDPTLACEWLPAWFGGLKLQVVHCVESWRKWQR